MPPHATELRRYQGQLLAWAVVGMGFLLVVPMARGAVQIGFSVALGLVLVGAGASYLRFRRTVTDVIRSASASPSPATAAGAARRVFRDLTRRRRATAMAVVSLVALPALVDDWSQLSVGDLALPISVIVLAFLPALRIRRLRVETDRNGLHLVGFLRTRHLHWTRIVGAGFDGSGLTVLLDDDRVVRSIAAGAAPGRPHVEPLLEVIDQRARGPGRPR